MDALSEVIPAMAILPWRAEVVWSALTGFPVP
jgi:hypothetical protein